MPQPLQIPLGFPRLAARANQILLEVTPRWEAYTQGAGGHLHSRHTQKAMPESRLRVGDAATILGVTEDHLRSLCNDKKIPCDRTPGGHRLFDPQLLEHIKEYGLGKWMDDYEKTVAALAKAEQYDPKKGRQVDTTVTCGFFVMDTGNEMVAGFGRAPARFARNWPRNQPLHEERFWLCTDSTTYATIEGITLVVDPLVLDEQWSADTTKEAKASYAGMLNALLCGEVIIDAIPFARVLAMSKIRVIQAAYPGNANMIAPGLDVGPKETHPDVRVNMSPASHIGVHLRVPNRSMLEQPKGGGKDERPKPNLYTSEYEGFCKTYTLTGLVMIEQRNVTLLGASLGTSISR